MSLVAPDLAYRVPTPDPSSVNALVNKAWADAAGQESTDAAIRSIFELRGAGRIPADTALVLIGQAVTDYLRAKLDGIITAYRQAKVYAYRGETRCEIVHQTETRSLGSLGFADYHARLKIEGTENPDNRIRPLAEIVLVTKTAAAGDRQPAHAQPRDYGQATRPQAALDDDRGGRSSRPACCHPRPGRRTARSRAALP